MLVSKYWSYKATAYIIGMTFLNNILKNTN